jgi:hypothetical protein
MTDSAGSDSPRIQRLTLWALALDLGTFVVLYGLVALDSLLGTDATEAVVVVTLLFGVPIVAGTALLLSVRSALKAGRLMPRVAGWVTALFSCVLLIGYLWVLYGILFPTCISCG